MNKKLTPREKQVCELLILGTANIDIAIALSMSKDAVKKHLKNLFRKFNAKNRTHLAYILGKDAIL